MSKDTHTPLFPVEPAANETEAFSERWDLQNRNIKASEAQEEKVEEIFRAACKGNDLNHTKGGGATPNRPAISGDKMIRIAWQPHNYRLYFEFDKSGFTPEKPANHTLQEMKGMVPEFNPAYTWTSLNWDSEHRYADFMLCDIRVKKHQVEIIPRSHAKKWRKMEADNPDVIEEKQMEILKRLEFEARKALRVFVDLHGGSTSWEYARAPRIEDGTRGDDFLDSLPPDQVIHDDLFKKVYRHKVEFKGQDPDGTLRSQNYIHNRAAEKVTPAIVEGQDQIVAEVRRQGARTRAELDGRRDDPIGWIFANGHAEDLNDMSPGDRTAWLRERFAL